MGKKKDKTPKVPGSAKSRLRIRSTVFTDRKKAENKNRARKPVDEEDC